MTRFNHLDSRTGGVGKLIAIALALLCSGGGLQAQSESLSWRNRLRHDWEPRRTYFKVVYDADRRRPDKHGRSADLECGLHTPIGLLIGGWGRGVGKDKLYRFPDLAESPNGYADYPWEDYESEAWLAGYGMDTDLAPPGYPFRHLRRLWQLRLVAAARFQDREDDDYRGIGTTRDKTRIQVGRFLLRRKEGALSGLALEADMVRFTRDLGLNYRVGGANPYDYHQHAAVRGDRLAAWLSLPVTADWDLHLGYGRHRLTRYKLEFTDASATMAGSMAYAAAFPYPDMSHSTDEHRFYLGATKLCDWGTIRLDLGLSSGDTHGFLRPVDLDRSFHGRCETRLFGADRDSDLVLGAALESHSGRSDPFTILAYGSAFGGAPLGSGYESTRLLKARLYCRTRAWEAGIEARRSRGNAHIQSAPLPVLQAGTNSWFQDDYGLFIRTRALENLVVQLNLDFGQGRSRQHLLVGAGLERRKFDLTGTSLTFIWKF